MDQGQLHKELAARGVSEEVLQRVVSSGYGLMPVLADFKGGVKNHVADFAYGSKMASGLFNLDRFIACLSGEIVLKANVPSYEVGSLSEMNDILNTDRHKRFRDAGLMSFRGQNHEHWMTRAFPNPYMSDEKGRERLIIPSFWRQFKDDWNARFNVATPPSIFSTIFGDCLVYYGLPSSRELAERNVSRYGVHTLSDLEDFDDPESREYGRRWRLHKVMQPGELILVEQHYGIDTCGLDVTFDPSIALFFASNRFMRRSNGMACYEPIPASEHQGVCYAFVFEDPHLSSTHDLVKKIAVFDHIPPVRPLWQKCALPSFGAYNFNEAVADLDAVYYLKADFNPVGLPAFRDLFPSADEDPFYRALIDAKKRHPSRLEGFLEYDFR